MSKIITHITGKKLMERWNMDGYDVLQVIKNEELEISPGSYNARVEFARLLLAEDIPRDLDNKMASFQFALSEIESVEKKSNLLSEKQTDFQPKEESDEALINKKFRPSTEDKIKCQEIAKKAWEEHLLDIKYMKMHPEIKKIVGRRYKDKTVHGWLSKVAPDEVKKGGIRSNDYEKKQLAICKKLGIEVLKK